MVGASLACLLEQLPLRLALVDQNAFDLKRSPYYQKQPKFDARVSAITAASKKLFTSIGIWQEIEKKRICNYRDMHVWDADGTGSIHFNATDINQSELGTIVENSVVLGELYAKLAKLSKVNLIVPSSIESLQQTHIDGEQCVQLQTEEGNSLTAKLLIAADGANSRIRDLANFTTREWDYNHQALITTVRTELAHNNTALQCFMETGPLAFLPLAIDTNSDDQHYCSIVWSAIPEKSEELLALSDDQFKAQLAACIENELGKIEWVDQRFVFPLRQRHATEYVQGNIVLVGDAAHTIHPLAGQGVNLGLLDVDVLSQELTRGLAAGRGLADATVLSRYQRKRIGHNLGMMWLMEGFKHLFAEQVLPVRWLRNLGMSKVDNLSLVKNQLTRRAMGLDW